MISNTDLFSLIELLHLFDGRQKKTELLWELPCCNIAKISADLLFYLERVDKEASGESMNKQLFKAVL